MSPYDPRWAFESIAAPNSQCCYATMLSTPLPTLSANNRLAITRSWPTVFSSLVLFISEISSCSLFCSVWNQGFVVTVYKFGTVTRLQCWCHSFEMYSDFYERRLLKPIILRNLRDIDWQIRAHSLNSRFSVRLLSIIRGFTNKYYYTSKHVYLQCWQKF